MSERVKGAMFNVIGDITDMTVLDAFAGTGALGFESLSRGAAHVTFIERDRAAQNVIMENAATLKVDNETKLVRASVAAWSETSDGQKFDLIFADPPYHDVQFSTVSRLFNHLKPNGLMILSHPGRESAPTVNGVVVVDNRSYGDAALAFYRNDAAE
jgi:16S rRNA (guanine966-N2)-methyltransferase